MKSYREAISRLYDLEHSGIKLGLGRIRHALSDLGSPQDEFASIHVAGTNGKGSTSALFAGVLHASGLKTGLYTSPHLLDFRERIRIGGAMAGEDEICSGLESIWPAVERHGLSFFEAATCLAFRVFANRRVDAAVLEVGLGGRLDATNVVQPALTVITSLSIDHQKTLGASLGEIAREKAGILKRGAPLILASAPYEARRACLTVALQRGAPVVLDREVLAVRDLHVDTAGSRWVTRRRDPGLAGWLDGAWRLSLVGAHQVENARLVQLGAAALQERGWTLSGDSVRAGLRSTRWPGRFESLEPRWPVLLDVAHNPEGARHLVRTLKRVSRAPVRWVTGMVRGKHHREFLSVLGSAGEPVHLCTPINQRAVTAESMAEHATALGLRHSVHSSVEDALRSALHERRSGELCVVTGSFFTLDEACRSLGVSPLASLHEPVEIPS